jgi:hypothetical protein
MRLEVPPNRSSETDDPGVCGVPEKGLGARNGMFGDLAILMGEAPD